MNTNLTEYKQYLANDSKSPDTIITYTNRINLYLNKNTSNEITRESILQYISSLSGSGKTINLTVTALISYCNYLYNGNHNLISTKDKIKIQEENFAPKIYGSEKVSKMLSIIKQKENIRNYTIIILMYAAGTRITETLNLKLDDIDYKNNKLTIHKGKGNKERTIRLGEEILTILKEYFPTRNNYKHASTSPYLFVSQMGDKLNRDSINKILEKYNINPHQFRHECASRMLNTGTLNIVELKNFLGHSSIETTMRYTHPDEKDMHSRIDKLSLFA